MIPILVESKFKHLKTVELFTTTNILSMQAVKISSTLLRGKIMIRRRRVVGI